jgi:nucleoside-diphosphate-sugar epimerase
MPVRTLIFGCGYLGVRVARMARDRGDAVFATTRDPEKAKCLAGQGFTPVFADWSDSRSLARLPEVDRVLVAVSYDRRSSQDRYETQVGGFARLLKHLGGNVNVCYISTTGVYHQMDGSWVDENSPARARRDGGKAHLDAESLLWRMRPDSKSCILRLAGIYGPGRIPRAADVIAGRPIASLESGYLNLIHVDDAAAAVLASWASPAERLYVVADDEPMLRGDFYREIARQTRSAEPTFVSPPANSPKSFRSETNKRIWNRRLKRDLVPRLEFPTYREGLANSLES